MTFSSFRLAGTARRRPGEGPTNHQQGGSDMRAMKWWTGVLCMLAFLGLTSTASAVKIQKDLPAGVTLTPEERAHGEAVVVTGADERSTAVQVGTGADAALVKTSVPTG